MFKIIGADGKEYGPISLEQLRQWMSEGRIHSGTQVKPEGATGWQTLGSLPEFVGQSPPPPPPSQRPLAAPVNSKMSVMAVISLVLGILGIFSCGVTALVGLVLGIVALLQVKKSDGRLTGMGIAIAGIITSAIFMLVLPFYAMVLSGVSKAKSRAQSILCINNVKQLSLAARMYSMNNKDQLPTASNWCDLIQTNATSARMFQCSLDSVSRCGFAFNAKISGKKTGEVNPQTVLFFESKAGWNAAGGAELMSSAQHDNGTTVIAFADGSVMKMTQSQMSNLRWDP